MYKSKELLEQYQRNAAKVKFLETMDMQEASKLKYYFDSIENALSVLSPI